MIPYEDKAKRGEPMPEGLRLHEQWAYQAMAALVDRFKLKRLSGEDAKREANQIRMAYDAAERQQKFIDKQHKHMSDFWKEIEFWTRTYAHERTIENANNLWKKANGLIVYDANPSEEIAEYVQHREEFLQWKKQQ